MSDRDTGPRTPAAAPLEFDTDRGAARATWIAAALVLALIGWMGSGLVLPAEETPEPLVADRTTALEPVTVAVRTSVAELVTQVFQAEGQALPDRDTAIRAEISGDIAEVVVPKGAEVAMGDVVARFDVTQGQAELRRAQEELSRAQRDFDNAEELLERGVATGDRVAQTRVALAAAEAAVTNAEEALKAAIIVAPFDGRIERLDLDPGEFVSAGAEVGRIVDNRPLTISIQVPQQELTRLTDGLPAQVAFITGETREGLVVFVGTSANAETRTFLAEIEVDNDDGAIPAGVSAEVRIPTGQQEAHFVSPSILALNERGDLGVKVVEDGNVVAFYPVEVVEAQIDGIWITGLPHEAQIITIGQGFVGAGETVRPQAEEGGADPAGSADMVADDGPTEALDGAAGEGIEDGATGPAVAGADAAGRAEPEPEGPGSAGPDPQAANPGAGDPTEGEADAAAMEALE